VMRIVAQVGDHLRESTLLDPRNDVGVDAGQWLLYIN
jgi:hypothetical protein